VADPKSVFLSYRREVSWAMAHLVRNELVAHGFDVFMDVHGIDAGEFERVILARIEAYTHFLVLLEPRSLDRLTEEGDWLRREIAHALAHDRNVVPLLANGARMPRPTDLPTDLARLPSLNAVSVPHDYFAEAMQKLRERFLRTPEPLPTGGPPPMVGLRLVSLRRGPALSEPTLSQRRGVTSPLEVTLDWTKVKGAKGYEVEQSTTAYFARSRSIGRMVRTHHHMLRSDLDRGRFFRVRATATWGLFPGPWSNTVEMR
jgi:hypothetical protein